VVTIHYDEHLGGGSEKGRPSLVLIHGSGGTRLHWPSEIRRMKGEDVYALDLPGHGKSSPPSERSIAGYVQRLNRWLAALGLERVVLVGHSMGGAIALRAALDMSQEVVGLVLVGSGARLRVHPAILEITSDPRQFKLAVMQIQEWAFGPEAPPRLVELARKRLLETDPQVLYTDFLACDAFDMMDQIGKIEAPCLAVCGSEDRLTPPKYSRYLGENIPHCRVRIIEGAGHMVMLERPKQVASVIEGFLTSGFPRRGS
jgi:pimeloyl-ACP methyl ester carboxylesterase